MEWKLIEQLKVEGRAGKESVQGLKLRKKDGGREIDQLGARSQ